MSMFKYGRYCILFILEYFFKDRILKFVLFNGYDFFRFFLILLLKSGDYIFIFYFCYVCKIFLV